MELLIIKICIMFLSISNICMLIVVIKLTNRVNLHSKLISGAWYYALNKEEEEEEEEEED